MPLTDNLISFWELEEASGTRADAHGTNDLTDNNTVGSGTGKVGTAADFDPSASESLTRADNADLSTGNVDFTFCLWVNEESAIGSTRVYAGKLSSLSASVCEWALVGNDAPNNWYLFISDGASFTTLNSGAARNTGSWRFIVVWHDASANEIGIQVDNGTPVTASYSAGSHDSAEPFNLGGVSGLHANGLIDQVGFWKQRVLTSQERTDLYNSGNGLSYDDMVGAAGGAFPFRIDPMAHMLVR